MALISSPFFLYLFLCVLCLPCLPEPLRDKLLRFNDKPHGQYTLQLLSLDVDISPIGHFGEESTETSTSVYL